MRFGYGRRQTGRRCRSSTTCLPMTTSSSSRRWPRAAKPVWSRESQGESVRPRRTVAVLVLAGLRRRRRRPRHRSRRRRHGRVGARMAGQPLGEEVRPVVAAMAAKKSASYRAAGHTRRSRSRRATCTKPTKPKASRIGCRPPFHGTTRPGQMKALRHRTPHTHPRGGTARNLESPQRSHRSGRAVRPQSQISHALTNRGSAPSDTETRGRLRAARAVCHGAPERGLCSEGWSQLEKLETRLARVRPDKHGRMRTSANESG